MRETRFPGLRSFASCHTEAERYARGELIADDVLDPVAGRLDHELAGCFGMPLDQIQRKRAGRYRAQLS